VLAAGQRLRRRDEFTAAIRGGRRAGRGVLVVHLAAPEQVGAVDGDEGDPGRAGFVIPRTVGGAVQRNKVRRRLRHLVRDRLADLPRGTRLVIRALPGAADRSYAQLGADLDAALTAALRRPRARG
jgi:ribonuclease P protein component